MELYEQIELQECPVCGGAGLRFLGTSTTTRRISSPAPKNCPVVTVIV